MLRRRSRRSAFQFQRFSRWNVEPFPTQNLPEEIPALPILRLPFQRARKQPESRGSTLRSSTCWDRQGALEDRLLRFESAQFAVPTREVLAYQPLVLQTF